MKKKQEPNWIEVKERLEQLPEIKRYMEWLRIPSGGKKRIREAWNKYYSDCRKTEAFELWRLASIFSKSHSDNSELKKITQRARNKKIENDF